MPPPKEDPWHDLESELDVALRDVKATQEKYRAIAREFARKRGGSEAGSPVKGGNPFLRERLEGGGGPDWERMPAAKVQEFDTLVESMAAAAGPIEEDIGVLKQVVQAALDHPDKHTVAATELQRRQEVIQAFTRRLDAVRGDVAEGERHRSLRDKSGYHTRAGAAAPVGNVTSANQFMSQEYAEQHVITEQQNAALARIEQGVKEAEMKAKTIGGELDVQAKDLEALDSEMTGVQAKLENAAGKVSKMLDRTSDKGKVMCILGLLVVLVLLVVFVFTDNSGGSNG